MNVGIVRKNRKEKEYQQQQMRVDMYYLSFLLVQYFYPNFEKVTSGGYYAQCFPASGILGIVVENGNFSKFILVNLNHFSLECFFKAGTYDYPTFFKYEVEIQ